MLAHICN